MGGLSSDAVDSLTKKFFNRRQLMGWSAAFTEPAEV